MLLSISPLALAELFNGTDTAVAMARREPALLTYDAASVEQKLGAFGELLPGVDARKLLASTPRLLADRTRAELTASVPTHRPSTTAYGFGTQQLAPRDVSGRRDSFTGLESTSSLAQAWGHWGASYGYNAMVAYYPELDLVLAVASNVETEHEQRHN